MAPEGNAVVTAHDMQAAYAGDLMVLQGTSITLRRGQVSGIIGPNGAGKSTALKALVGLLRLRRGRIALDGEDITALAASERAAKGVAFVPQHRSTFGELSVDDNLRLGAWSFRRDKPRMAQALERVYAQFPALAAKKREQARALSGGQQRFLEIARALMLAPRVVLFDEPTAMIAPKAAKEIYAFIRTLADGGTTVALVDQNVRSCAAIADHLYILELGRNKAEGTREQFNSDDALRDMVAEWVAHRVD